MPPAPDHDEVHIILIRPDEALARHSVGLWLTLDREERARALAAGTRAEWFVAVHGLLRSALGEALGAAPKSLCLSRGPGGKPFVAAPPEGTLRFSLSRTPALGVIAITRGREVGVDVEDLRAVDGAAELARRCFPPRDLEALSRTPPAHFDREFLRLWTRSESRLKARGEGRSGAAPPTDVPEPPGAVKRRWDTVDLALGREHVGAVTIERGPRARLVAWRAAAAREGPRQFTFTRTELTANAT